MSKHQNINHLWFLHFFADFAAIIAAYFTALLIRFHSDLGERFYYAATSLLGEEAAELQGSTLENFYIASAFRIILILTVVICIFYAIRGLYPGRRFILKRPIAWNVIVANLAALAFFYAYFYLSRNTFHPRSLFASVILLNIIYCVAFRTLVNRFLNALRNQSNTDRCNAILLGTSSEAEFINALVAVMHPHGIRIAKRLHIDPDEPFEEQMRFIRKAVEQHDGEMIISAEQRLAIPQIMQLLELSDNLRIPIKVVSDKLDILANRAGISCDIIKGLPLIHFDAPKNKGRLGWVRRSASLALAWIALLLLLPVMGIIGLFIRLTSKGPALFIQERIGINRKPFRMFKFRTMHNRAEEERAQLEELNESGDGLFKIRKDPRITTIGRWLRRFSLDELPQLFNVVKGDMTIVGPRPLPRSDFESYYEDWHYSRHDGLPGLTCLWQISGRSDIDFHNMCILDIYYLRNHTWVLDLKIALKTFWTVLFTDGAY